MFDLTGSALGVSAVVFAEIPAGAATRPLAGTIVDRLPRVPVMVALRTCGEPCSPARADPARRPT
ncbi:MFS transporter [Pseudonocardia sp. MCCB 268]|nr:MFS transporter [Pseudonocardia cytotoxica]